MEMRRWRDSRAAAEEATLALEQALAGLGLPERQYRHIRSAVTASGKPYVYVGLVTAELAEKIAEALGRPPGAGS